MKRRLDLALLERGLAPSRARARALVEAGRVTVNGAVVLRPAAPATEDDVVEVSAGVDFVSRGGHKLDAALTTLGVEIGGRVCADVGASTGGFTHCLLRRGARRVYAIDVGTGQLAEQVRRDPRVSVMDGVNARGLGSADFDASLDLVVVDASFISLDKLAAALARMLPAGGRLVALIKPNFEVGRAAARRRRGVVRDPVLRQRAIAQACGALQAHGFTVLGGCDSALPGPSGNLEYFAHAERGPDPALDTDAARDAHPAGGAEAPSSAAPHAGKGW